MMLSCGSKSRTERIGPILCEFSKNQPLFWHKVLIDFFSKVEVLICQKPGFRAPNLAYLGALISKSGLEVHYCEHFDWRTVAIVWGVDAELCEKQKECISNPKKISFVNFTVPPFSTPSHSPQTHSLAHLVVPSAFCQLSVLRVLLHCRFRE